jgi:Tfp pilus assembly protein PilO
MSERFAWLANSTRGRKWAYGGAIGAVGVLLAVLPAALQLQSSARGLETTRHTYESKLAWVGQRDVIERRLRETEATAAALDAKLLTDPQLPGFTQDIATAAREAGCAVRSIRPLAPRTIPRPGADGKAAAAEDKDAFLEYPVRLDIDSDYHQLTQFIDRLWNQPRHLRLTRLVVQPNLDDCEQLRCEIEISSYGLKPPADEGS